MTKATHGRVIGVEGWRVITALGNRLTLRVRSEDTGGAFAVVDFEVAPSFVAPPVPHRHSREDWWGHVTDGELAIELDGVTSSIPTGATVFVPRGASFRWWNPVAQPARWTLTYAPGGFERYFEAVADALAAQAPASRPDLAALVAPLWTRFGLAVSPSEGART